MGAEIAPKTPVMEGLWLGIGDFGRSSSFCLGGRAVAKIPGPSVGANSRINHTKLMDFPTLFSTSVVHLVITDVHPSVILTAMMYLTHARDWTLQVSDGFASLLPWSHTPQVWSTT